MKLLKELFFDAVSYLTSFFVCLPKTIKRAICVICVLCVLSAVLPLVAVAYDEETPELHQMSLELTPNDSAPDVTITYGINR